MKWQHTKSVLLLVAVAMVVTTCGSDPPIPTASTDVTPPSIVSVFPGDGGTGVGVTDPVRVTFTEPIDRVSFQAAFTLSDPSGAIAGTVTYESNDEVAVFTPGAPLTPLTPYTATVTTVVKDLAGNALEKAKTWSFTTGDPPTAIAGDDQDVNMGEGVTLRGSGTGQNLTYRWTQVADQKPTVVLSGADTATPTFDAPDEVVTLDFELVVENEGGPSAPATVKVVVLADKDNKMFVSEDGSDSNPGTRGTRAEPFATITAAIVASRDGQIATGEFADIYVAGGTFNEHLNLITQVNIYGGFEHGDLATDTRWSRRPPDPANPPSETNITGGTFTRGATRVSVDIRTQNNITIDGVTITSKSATADGGSSIAVSLWRATAVTISRCNIVARDGAKGADGGPFGSVGASGEPGDPGRNGNCNIPCPTCVACGGGSGNCNSGGPGGGAGDLSLDPGDGGGGGVSGTNCGCEGRNGRAFGEVFGGRGGQAPGGEGFPGNPGETGDNGAPGPDYGGLATNGYNGASGGKGGQGNRGSGAGGGAGAGGVNNGCSGSGGGGGQGGEGSDGGRGGSGGGGSFGIMVGLDSEATIVDCVINTGIGGKGGTGHDGIVGENGGDPGLGAPPSNGGGHGGDGGRGGRGGQGGPGAGGGGGPSIAIVEHSTATTNSDRETSNLFPGNVPPGGGEGGEGGESGRTQTGRKGTRGKTAEYYKES